MALLEWRDGFSVGVQGLDADHRRVIDLVNELDAAGRSPGGHGGMMAAFADLQQHLASHFAREERLLERAGYPDLAEQREEYRRTLERVAHFSGLVAAATDTGLPRQVLDFLCAWFVNHLVRCDLDMRPHLERRGLTDVPRPPDPAVGLAQRLGRRLDFLGIRWRISLLALIPLIAFMVGAAIGANDRFQAAAGITQMRSVATLGIAIGDLVHELQKERGMSSLFLASKGEKFGPELKLQRGNCDAKRTVLAAAIARESGRLDGTEAALRLVKAHQAVDDLDKTRGAVDRQEIQAKDAIGFYTGTIADLLSVVEGMQTMSGNADLLRSIAAYLAVIELKERAGQERAIGAAGFAAGSFSADLFQRFLDLGAAQRTYQQVFHSFADPALAQRFGQTTSGAVADEVAHLRKVATESYTQNRPLTVDPADWFKASSARIESLKQIEDAAAQDLAARGEALFDRSRQAALALCAAILMVFVAVVALALTLGASIAPPLVAITAAMRRLAEGERTVDVPGLGLRDELGEMAGALQFFKEKLTVADLLAAEGWVENVERLGRLERKEAMIASFDATMADFLVRLGGAAETLHGMAGVMSGAARDTTQRATTVAAATEQASANVQTVAAAAEQLSGSIAEISRQVGLSAEKSLGASEQARRAEAVVGDLADSATKIGVVVQLIQDIASQTNLLALNATIEAARAGEAGKGFAVVAGEVKGLANQTARATEEIGGQIASVQRRTQDVVVAIRDIGRIIDEIREISAGIAEAVAQQSNATREIALNIDQAAAGTAEVSSNVCGVQDAAGQTGQAAEKVLVASDELAERSTALSDTIQNFLAQVRIA